MALMNDAGIKVVFGAAHSARTKAIIGAMQNYELVGFVKSISYTKRTYKLTKFEYEAKGYASSSAIQKDLDMLNRIGYQDGTTFKYYLV